MGQKREKALDSKVTTTFGGAICKFVSVLT